MYLLRHYGIMTRRDGDEKGNEDKKRHDDENENDDINDESIKP